MSEATETDLMRRDDVRQRGMFSYVSLESRAPSSRPRRAIKTLLDEALAGLSRYFDRVYVREGCPSIPAKRLAGTSTLQVLYSIRSERLWREQLDCNLLFRWFVGLSIDEPIWDHSSFTKNRGRLIEPKIARKLLRRMVRKARKAQLLSNARVSVDGTLIEPWAADKSLRRRDGTDGPPGPGRHPWINWHGKKRTNEAHVSATDPQAKPSRPGQNQGAKLYFVGHVLMDQREGLAVAVEVPEANGYGKREAPLAMLDRHSSHKKRTVAADKGYDSADFIAECRKRRVTPHVAMNVSGQRDSAIDARTTRHPGYLASQRLRKRIEECFGWGKDGRPMRKMKMMGKQKVAFVTTLAVGCCTLLRLAKLRVVRELAPS